MASSSLSSLAISALFLTVAFLMMSLFVTTASAHNSMQSGERLWPGMSLKKDDFSFTMKNDCSFVLSNSNKTNLLGFRPQNNLYGCNLKLRHDGNLVMYRKGVMIWSSKTNKKTWKIYHLILRADHKLVINDSSNNTIWEIHNAIKP